MKVNKKECGIIIMIFGGMLGVISIIIWSLCNDVSGTLNFYGSHFLAELSWNVSSISVFIVIVGWIICVPVICKERKGGIPIDKTNDN